mgnify:CR=1 FL=1
MVQHYFILGYKSTVLITKYNLNISYDFQVHPDSSRSGEDLKMFELAGKIVGKCLFESSRFSSYRQSHRQLVKARFSRSFLAQLIGLRVHYKVSISPEDRIHLFGNCVCLIINEFQFLFR